MAAHKATNIEEAAKFGAVLPRGWVEAFRHDLTTGLDDRICLIQAMLGARMLACTAIDK